MTSVSFSKPAVLDLKDHATSDIVYNFQDRRDLIFNHYKKLFCDSKVFYSQFIKNQSYSFPENSLDFHIHFLPTNQIYQDSKIRLSFNQLPKNQIDKLHRIATHFAVTDLFGKILYIKDIENDTISHSLYQLFYGKPNVDYISWYERPHRLLLPYGNLISSINHFDLDEIGFRLTTEKKSLCKKDSNTINIAFFGGSFVSSIWSLPGESFCDQLEILLNQNCQNIKYQVFNFSNPGHVQSDGLNLLLNSGLYKLIDKAIWFDGVNDLLTTIPASKVGINNSLVPLSLKYNGVKIPNDSRNLASFNDKVDSYLYYRSIINEILHGLGIDVINILQPTIDKSSDNHLEKTKSLFPYYSRLPYKDSQKTYFKSLNMIKTRAKLEYNLEFVVPPLPNQPFDFWDLVHLSPKGELQIALWLHEVLKNKL